MKIGRHAPQERYLILILFLLALLPRVLSLNVFITWDEPMWTYRSIHFLTALLRGDFRGTFLVGHPGVMTMWAGATGISIQRLLGFGSATASEVETAFAWLSGLPTLYPSDAEAMRKLAPFLSAAKLPLAVLSAACVVGIYFLAKRLFGSKVSLLAALLLALDPFHLALSRVLHIDTLAGNFMILSLLSLLVHLRSLGFREATASESPTCWGHVAMDPNKFGTPMCHPHREITQLCSRFYLLLSGAFAGLAFLSKSYALFLVPFAGLTLTVACLTKEQDFRQTILLLLGPFATWCVVAALIVFLLWPAMWVDPLGTIQGVLDTAFGYAATAQATSKFFLGKIVTDPGAWFYPVVLAFRTTPLALLGLIIALPLLCQKTERGNLAAILAYACFFTILMTMGAKKFDRYMLPVVLALDIAAAWGLVKFGELVSQHLGVWTSGFGLWILLFLLQTGHILSYHPYYLTYYNPLLGGSPRAAQVLPVGWGEGMDLAADYLNQKEDTEELAVATSGIPGFAPLFEGRTKSLTKRNLATTDYALLYISNMQQNSPGMDLFRGQQVEHVVRIHGIDYVWIFQNAQHAELASYLKSRLVLDDVVLLDAPSSFVRHYQMPYHMIHDSRSEAEVAGKLMDIAAGHRRLWYIAYPEADPNGWIDYQLSVHTLLVERRTFPHLGSGNGVTVSCYLLPSRPTFDTTSIQADGYHLDVNFGDRLRLTGYGFAEEVVEYRKKLGVTLRWQAPLRLQEMKENYALSLRLVDSEGHLWAQTDKWLLNPSGLPTSVWKAGEANEERYLLPIPPGIPPGRYQVEVIVYQTDTLERVTIVDEKGKPAGTAYTLRTISVTSPTIPPALEELAIPHALSYDFDGQVELLGYGLSADEVHPGNILGLTLFWRALRPMEQDYNLLLELRDEAGHTWMEAIFPLPNESYPTSHWQPGELLSTPYDLLGSGNGLIDTAVPPERYRLLANLLDGDGATSLTEAESPPSRLLEESLLISELNIEGREHHFTMPEIRFPLQANIGHRVAFLGYDLDRTDVKAGGVLHLTLYWQAPLRLQARMDTSYTVFTHLLDTEGHVRGQKDSVPCGGTCPTTSWVEGEIITDEYEIAVHPDAPAGEYQIEIGMYDPETMSRLPTFDEAGRPLQDDRILLESMIIVESGKLRF